MHIVTTEQMQAAEAAADAAGHSYDQMMEHAGHAVAEAIVERFDIIGARVLVLVGPGNNGGDGLVAARYLAQMGAIVTVYIWKRDTEGDKNWALLEGVGVEAMLATDQMAISRLPHLLDEAAIIIDALLGTGVSRPIEGDLAALLEQAKQIVAARRKLEEGPLIELTRPILLDEEIGPIVIAVDVPTGLNSNTGHVDPHTLAADLTVSFAAPKLGHILAPGPTVVGQLVVADIGIETQHFPAEATLRMATASDVAAMLPARPVDAHKGTFGTAVIVAGSLNYTGAALLTGRACTRIGTGLVTLAPPRTIYPILAAAIADATYQPLAEVDGAIAAEAAKPLVAALGKAQALLVGPGLGQAETTAQFVENLLAEQDSLPPLLLDADALNILAQQENWWQSLPANCILTPHPGEMSRLTGRDISEIEAERLTLASEMAADWQQVILLKGAHTVIAAADGRTMVLPFANPALAKAGSGDVLAGTIVGLLAQGLEPFEAAIAGAYIHGLAGEFARQSLGVAAVTASDLVSFISVALRELSAP